MANKFASMAPVSRPGLFKTKAMKAQLATGFIPYEIGDKVLVGWNELIIEDIRMIQYIKSKKVHFDVLFEGDHQWHSWEIIDKRVISEQ